MDSPLLSYIDVRHPNFLPPNLTVGKAQDLGPQLVRENLLVLVRDASANSIFQGHVVHRPIKEPWVVVQPAKQAKAKSINSSEVEAEQDEGNMVTKRTMTIDRFIPDARLAA